MESGAWRMVEARLRLIATTDLHMELLARDCGPGGAPGGLEALAGVIARARDEAANVLMFDNGDLLQGHPLGDHLAELAARRRPGSRRPPPGPHPAIDCLNRLGCDAATLGNHDFGFGRRFLGAAIAAARYPVVAANIRGPGLAGVAPWCVLRRRLRTAEGGRHPLAIGVIGFVPPPTAEWEAAAWPGLETEDVIEAAARELPRLRAAGAELVVALSHGGAVEAGHVHGAENAAAALAAIPGIDAVIAGHMHRVLPPAGEVRRARPGGPAPMASGGFGGSHLAVIDLELRRGPEGWRVAGASAETRAAVPPARPPRVAAATEREGEPASPEAVAAALRASVARHARAAAAAGRSRAGRSAVALTSHFALIGVDAGLRLTAMAQRWHIRQALRGSRWEGLPVVIAVTPARAGGLGGPGNYVALPSGRLRRADLAALYPFPNLAAAIEVTGADLAAWLERGASAFRQVPPGARDAALIDPMRPSYDFDLLDGLDWVVDLGRPAGFAPDGRSLGPAGPGRIGRLARDGVPVDPEARFVLGTTSHRLAATGLYAALTAGRTPLPVGTLRVREVLARYLHRRRRVAPEVRPFFAFARVPGASALFDTAPAAVPEIVADRALTRLGPTPAGFLRLRLDLDP